MLYEKNELDIQKLLQNGKVFYKFSKSNEEYKNLTSEEFHKDYPEFSIIKADGYHGLSFCDDISKLLLCLGYGDQITQVIIDKNSKYYEDVEEFLEKEQEEYSRFGEYVTYTMQTGKNYSLKDPSVLNALIQESCFEGINYLFTYVHDGQKIESIYREYGFEETASFIENIKKEYVNRHDYMFYISKEAAAEIKEIANDLILKYKDKDLFSFEKAESEYEQNSDKTVDRRFEKINLFKSNDKEDMFRDIVYYLHVNHFTKQQSLGIIKILSENNIYEPNKLNIILPMFSRKFSDEMLIQIKHDIRNNRLNFEQTLDLLKEKNKNNFVRDESLIEKLSNLIKDTKMNKQNSIPVLQVMELNSRFR